MKKAVLFLLFGFILSGCATSITYQCIEGDCVNGQGTYTSSNGDKYVGEYKDGKKHGQGTFTFADGAKYVGQFKDGKRNGQGTYTFADGAKYVGEWKDGKRDGQGTYTFANGDKYVGQFKDAELNGQGTFTFANGDKYVGEFKDGKRDGQGTSTYANGDTCSGLFENNICWGTVTKDKKIELASMLDTAKTTCKELGFKEQTEKFSECALKLYSQSVELAAKNNQQVVMQGSNSGVMTIYDPVRDNNALMDKGMKMLSGRCTLGIDC
jgi:hypothetical protein